MKLPTKSKQTQSISFAQPVAEQWHLTFGIPQSASSYSAESVEEQYRSLADSAVTFRNGNVLEMMEDSLDLLTEQRNQLTDDPNFGAVPQQIGLLDEIERQMDDLEMQIYQFDNPRLKLRQSLQVLRQSKYEIEHCRGLLKKHAVTRKNTKST